MMACVGDREKCGARVSGTSPMPAGTSPMTKQMPADTSPRDSTCDNCTTTINMMDVLREEMDGQLAVIHRRLCFLEEISRDRKLVISRSVVLQPGYLGFLVDWQSGLLSFVSEDSAVKRAGVDVGWRLTHIEDMECTAEGLKHYAMGSAPFTAIFQCGAPNDVEEPPKNAESSPADEGVDRSRSNEMKKSMNDLQAQLQAQWQVLVEKRIKDIEHQLKDTAHRDISDLANAKLEATLKRYVLLPRDSRSHATTQADPASAGQSQAPTTTDAESASIARVSALSLSAAPELAKESSAIELQVPPEYTPTDGARAPLKFAISPTPTMRSVRSAQLFPCVGDEQELAPPIEAEVFAKWQEAGEVSIKMQRFQEVLERLQTQVSRLQTQDALGIKNGSGGPASTRPVSPQIAQIGAGVELAKVEEAPEKPSPCHSEIGPDKDVHLEFIDDPESEAKVMPHRSHRSASSDAELLVKVFREHAVTERYEVKESVWDVAMFIGTDEIGAGGSIFGVILLYLALFMQFTFCAIINDTFTIQTVNDHLVDDLKRWRTFAGHDLNFVDPISLRSLTSRVCDLDGSLPMSSGVVEVLTTIKNYMPRQEDRDLMIKQGTTPAIGYILPPSEGVGQMLCLLAIMVWYLTLSKDFAELTNLCWALRIMRTESATRIDVVHDKATLAAVTGTRKLLMGLLVFSRLVALCFMMVCGTLFLAYTVSMQEIILNAVALEIVFHLDELIFQALAPSKVRVLIKYMDALPTALQLRPCKGLDFRAPLFLGVIVTVTFLTIPILLAPQARTLKDARDAVCKGEQGFVALVNQFGLVTASKDGKPGSRSVESSYVFEAFRELIDFETTAVALSQTPLGRDFGLANNQSLSVLTVGLEGSDYSLRGYETMSLAETTRNWNSVCLDHESRSSGPILAKVLADAVGSAHASLTCHDAKYYRNHDSFAGVRSRQICPQSCGCNNQTSPLVLFKDTQGCPSTCITNYTNVFPCDDTSKSSTMFQNYLQGLFEMANADFYQSSGWGTCIQDMHTRLQQNGCNAVAHGSFIPNGCSWETDLCDPENVWHLKSLRYMCPESCKCKSLPPQNRKFCPSTCLFETN